MRGVLGKVRTSEIIVPEEIDHVYQVHCSEDDTTSGILNETGAWNVAYIANGQDGRGPGMRCMGKHEIRRIAL